jgi:aryl-alcohol dehydrogenase-like predicted oxidoreductase
MCHRPDPATPLEETIRSMEDLARAGKIIYWGVSEWEPAQIVKANAVAHQINARPCAVNQPRYNLLYRYPEDELFAVTQNEGIGNVVFSPLAHGMLTGKYKPNQYPPPASRAADPEQNMVIKRLYWSEENKTKAQQFVEIARQINVSTAQLAIAWCLRHPAVTSVILGARNVEQLKENITAAELEIPQDVIEKIEKLYPKAKDKPTI